MRFDAAEAPEGWETGWVVASVGDTEGDAGGSPAGRAALDAPAGPRWGLRIWDRLFFRAIPR